MTNSEAAAIIRILLVEPVDKWPVLNRNLGAHLVVTGKSCIIDFWPGTGLWIVRQQTPRKRGVRGLLDFLAKEK